jgi:hypothetical protein
MYWITIYDSAFVQRKALDAVMVRVDLKKRQGPTKRPRPWFWGAAVLFFVFYAVLAVAVLQRFPNSGDEYSYLLQAKILAQGNLSVPSVPEAIRDAFTLDHVVDDGRVRSKYPPGWPLLLAAGELVGQPWLINPLIGALFTAILFLILRARCSTRAAWLAMVPVGLSPFLAFQSASYMSHVTGLAAQALALWMVGHHRAERSGAWLAGAGAIIGFGFLTRPLNGALMGLAFLAWFRPAAYKRAFWFGVGVLPMVLLFLAYNAIQFGHPLTTGHDAYRPTLIALYGVEHPELSLSNVEHYAVHIRWLIDLPRWLVPGMLITVPFGIYSLWRHEDAVSRKLAHYCLTSLALTLAVSHLIVPSLGDTYGPRFLMQALVPIALFSGAGLDYLSRQRHWPVGVYVAGCAICAVVTINRYVGAAEEVGPVIEKRMTLERAVQDRALDQAVVFLRSTYRHGPHWYVRNSPSFKGKVVYAIDRGQQANEQVMAHYPGYTGYRFVWRRGTFEPLSRRPCPARPPDKRSPRYPDRQ